MKYLVTCIAVVGLGLAACGGGGGIADTCFELADAAKECLGEDDVTYTSWKTSCESIETAEEAATCELSEEGEAYLDAESWKCEEVEGSDPVTKTFTYDGDAVTGTWYTCS